MLIVLASLPANLFARALMPVDTEAAGEELPTQSSSPATKDATTTATTDNGSVWMDADSAPIKHIQPEGQDQREGHLDFTLKEDMIMPLVSDMVLTEEGYVDVEKISVPDGDFLMVERPDYQFVILELRLPRIILNSGLPAFMAGDKLLLPLGAFASSVGFPLTTNSQLGVAQGWFMREENTFNLNVAANRLVIGGNQVHLDRANVEIQFDDIYVTRETIEQWFNISLELDYGNMRIILISPTPLPLEAKLERARQQARLKKIEGGDGPSFEVNHPRYLLFSPPAHDVQIDLALPTTSQLEAETWRYRTIPQGNSYYARGAGDLLYMHGTWTLMGSEFDPLSKANLRLERSDPSGNMGGWLGLTNIAIGDITSPKLHLVTRGIQGRGFQFTNQPLTRPTAFDRITVEGFTTPGWEIELHRNDVLLDYQLAGQDGRYFFEDVPLTFGPNDIKLVFFGPHGEVQTEHKAIFIGPGMIKEGEHQFSFSLSQNELDLFPVSSRRPVSLSTGDPRLVLEYEHGLTESLSFASHFATLPVYDEQHYYGGMGLRTSFKQLYAVMDAIINAPDGVAAHIAMHTQFWRLNLVAEHAQFFGNFTSEQFLSRGDPMRTRSRVRVNGFLESGAHLIGTLPYSIEVQNDRRESGYNLTKFSHRMSARMLGATVSHNMNWMLTTMGQNTAFGSLSVVRRGHKFSPLGQIVYEPTEGVHLYRLGVDIRLRRHLMARTDFTHQLADMPDMTLRAGFNHRFDRLAWGVNAGMSSVGGLSAGVSLSTGFAWDPHGKTMEITSRAPSSSGTTVPRVFWDKNLDNEFDAELDTPLTDVSFVVNNSRRGTVRTGAEGAAVLGELPPHAYANLEIDRKTLVDPFLLPVPDGISLVSRPGRVEILPMPVVMTGEIDGMVYLHQGEATFPAGGLKLKLLDKENTVVAEVESTYDGFYLFDFIKPGRYSIQVDPEQLNRLGMVNVNQVANLTIEGSGTILSDQIILLEPAGGTTTQDIIITDK